MNDTQRSRLEILVELLAVEVADRLEARWERETSAPEPEPRQEVRSLTLPLASPEAAAPTASEPALGPEVEHVPEPSFEPEPLFDPTEAPSLASHTAVVLRQLALAVCIIVVLINIPLNTQGTALARSIPNSASLIIRNGLLVKQATSPDVWVYQDNAFHRISSIEAFQQLGYRWQDVHIVNAGFLEEFPKGSPRYALLTCPGSPHYYQLEAGRKRWIVDIPTFEAEGYVWQDLKVVPCTDLHSLPDGDSIPPGHGTPPAAGP